MAAPDVRDGRAAEADRDMDEAWRAVLSLHGDDGLGDDGLGDDGLWDDGLGDDDGVRGGTASGDHDPGKRP